MIHVQKQALFAIQKSQAKKVVVNERRPRPHHDIPKRESTRLLHHSHLRTQRRVPVHVANVGLKGGIGVMKKGALEFSRQSTKLECLMYRSVIQPSDTTLEESQLSTTKLLTLKQISEADEPLSLGQLASCLAFVKSNATQLVDRLETETLVRRVPALHDRRCTLLEVTEEGRQRYVEGLQALEPLLERMESLYSAEERTQLLALLRKMTDSLK